MAVATKKRPVVKKKTPKRKETYVAIGCDVSMTNISIAAVGYDKVLGKRGPEFSGTRWTKEIHYFDRLRSAALGYKFILDVIGKLGIYSVELANTVIAIEEPWPMGLLGHGKFSSGFAKQQSQIHGAFLGSLLRYGYINIFEINNQHWRKICADALGITTHHTKWGSGVEGKMRAKEWALQEFPEIEEFPDIVQHSKLGLIERPEGSRARAVQCHDNYDALAMSMWAVQEIHRSAIRT
jgi:hypothetical protein